jgi:hypothetical protein
MTLKSHKALFKSRFDLSLNAILVFSKFSTIQK